jgi:HD-like signal output (HDOD) protein
LNAAIGAAFAQKHFHSSGDVAFVLGLLQDIGVAVLSGIFEDRYARLIMHAQSCGPARLHVIEREDLKVDHSEISAAIVEQWGFPEELQSAVRFHHDLKATEREPKKSHSAIYSMRVAESIADLYDNRHPSRRQDLINQLSACSDGQTERGFCSLEGCVHLAPEIAQQFRTPHIDEALLTSILRDVFQPSARS